MKLISCWSSRRTLSTILPIIFRNKLEIHCKMTSWSLSLIARSMKLIQAHSESGQRTSQAESLIFCLMTVDDRHCLLFMFHIKQDLAEVWTRHGTSSILSPTHTHTLTHTDVNGHPQTRRDQPSLRGVPVRTDFFGSKFYAKKMDFLIPHFSHICTCDMCRLCSFCLCSVSNKAELEEDRFVFLDCFCLPTSALLMSFFADRKNCVFNKVFIVDLIQKGPIVSCLVGQP